MGKNEIELPTETNGKWQVTETNYAVQIAQRGNGWISVLCEIPTLPYGDKEKDLATAFKICEAVNNYDKLKEDNALLLEALKGLYDFNLGGSDYLDVLLNNAEAILQKLKTNETKAAYLGLYKYKLK